MRISVIGTGYVGLVQGAVFADTGNAVVCMDINAAKIDQLRRGEIPIYEPGLEPMVRRNIDEGRLHFTTSLSEAVRHAEVLFLCLPTPEAEDGSADLSHVIGVTGSIAERIAGRKIVVSKSTVPVGTVDRLQEIFSRHRKRGVEVVSNPEFLKEGAAVQDSLKPDRIIVGTRSEAAARVMQDLYAPFVRTGNPIIVMDVRSAEMTKYAANALLATKITFMNELALLCEKLGADVDRVRRGIGSDPRIGQQFLFAGVGYGGSCFPKDVKALIKTAEGAGEPAKILRAVDAANDRQKRFLAEKVMAAFRGRLKGKVIALWGLSFKPQTDDMREAPSLVIMKRLLSAGAKIRAHDPVAMHTARTIVPRSVELFEDQYDALRGADALVVITEWNQFRQPDFVRMKRLMKRPALFDGRNIYDPAHVRQSGFTYAGIGRAPVKRLSKVRKGRST